MKNINVWLIFVGNLFKYCYLISPKPALKKHVKKVKRQPIKKPELEEDDQLKHNYNYIITFKISMHIIQLTNQIPCYKVDYPFNTCKSIYYFIFYNYTYIKLN
jgi:hypothetical protein